MIYLIILLGIYLGIKEYLHYVERKDLYNRIMAKDYTEYKSRGDPPKPIKNMIKKKMENRGDNV